MTQRDNKGITKMGMAASQARLLMITARIHDVEYQAQMIQNAKVQLATQEDQVYNEYQRALDESTLTVTAMDNGNQSILTANFNNLFSVNRVNTATGRHYALFDKDGRMIVDNDIYIGYQNFEEDGFEDNAYHFALYMMDLSEIIDSSDIMSIEDALCIDTEDTRLKELRAKVAEIAGTDPEEDPYAIYDTSNIYDDEEAMEEYEKALNLYETYLYSHNAEALYDRMNNYTEVIAPSFDIDKFEYYVQMYKTLQVNQFACRSIEDSKYNGYTHDAKTNSKWLTSMVQSGQLSIREIVEDPLTGVVTLDGANPSSDENLNYTTTTQIDSKALAKAEAKYEHDLKVIDKKDKQYDLSLSKLETERTALTTEHDSIKKVIEDNIQRTFGIFS